MAIREESVSAGRILVVDDDPQIRRVMRLTLTAQGYEVSDAKSGEEALERLNSENYDLVLLDMNMSGMGGIKVCRTLPCGTQRKIKSTRWMREPTITSPSPLASRSCWRGFVPRCDEYPPILAWSYSESSSRMWRSTSHLGTSRAQAETCASRRRSSTCFPTSSRIQTEPLHIANFCVLFGGQTTATKWSISEFSSTDCAGRLSLIALSLVFW